MNKSVKIWIKLMRFGKKLGCHQLPERSFSIKGFQFPVCARCTGVILGELISIALWFVFTFNPLYNFLLLIPMGVDWGLQRLKILQSTNIRRLITGILGGYALTNLYIFATKCLISAIFN